MFRPNVTCEISHMDGSDLYGKRSYTSWTRVPMAVVRLTSVSEKTSVRTDASASRGSAQELKADARLLFPTTVVLKQGDRVRVHGIMLTVASVFPRHSVTGHFDHWQVDCNVYYEG